VHKLLPLLPAKAVSGVVLFTSLLPPAFLMIIIITSYHLAA
jgi:hypothetical protein